MLLLPLWFLKMFFFLAIADPITSWGEQNPVCQESSLQDYSWGDVRYLWEIRTDTTNPNVSSVSDTSLGNILNFKDGMFSYIDDKNHQRALLARFLLLLFYCYIKNIIGLSQDVLCTCYVLLSIIKLRMLVWCSLCVFLLSEGTHLKPEEQLMLCTKTSSMPRMPATTCRASTSATVTSLFCTTMQTEYVSVAQASTVWSPNQSQIVFTLCEKGSIRHIGSS